MSSTSDKINGKIKQTVGKITNNKELEIKGKIEETKGKIKNNLERASEKAATKMDDISLS